MARDLGDRVSVRVAPRSGVAMAATDPYRFPPWWVGQSFVGGRPLPYGSAPLVVVETRSRRRVKISIIGEIDLSTRDRLRTVVSAAVAGDVREVCVDLARAEFLDRSGIAALVTGRDAASAAGCRFQITGAHGLVAQVLAVARVLEFLGGDRRTRRASAHVRPPAAA